MKVARKGNRGFCLLFVLLFLLGNLNGTLAPAFLAEELNAPSDTPEISSSTEGEISTKEDPPAEPAPAPTPAPPPQEELSPEQRPTLEPEPNMEPNIEPDKDPDMEPGTEPEETEAFGDLAYASSLSGMLWLDANEDGIQDYGEPPVANYPVALYSRDDRNRPVAAARTDAYGRYAFTGLEAGWYSIRIEAQKSGTGYLLPDIGVKNDNLFAADPDGAFPLSQWIASTDWIWVGADTVVEGLSAGMRARPEADGLPEPALELEPAPEPEETGADPDEADSLDAAAHTNGISGVLWADANEDGAYDGHERPVADYPVSLYGGNDMETAVATATTGTDGTYAFMDLAPDLYRVRVDPGQGGTEYRLPLIGLQNDNAFAILDDWLNSGSPQIACSVWLQVEEDTALTDIHLGMWLPAEEAEESDEPGSISGFLWIDRDGDGLLEAGGGMPGADGTPLFGNDGAPLSGGGDRNPFSNYTLLLYAAEDGTNPLAVTMPGADGNYSFGDLEPGDYVLGLQSGPAGGEEYALPAILTEDNRFSTGLSGDPTMAQTGTIQLAAGQSAENVNAGMTFALALDLTYAATIDLSTTTMGNSGVGYDINGTALAYTNTNYAAPVSDRGLTFNANAHNKTFHIIQTGKRSNPAGLHSVKEGTSIFLLISVSSDVNVTLVVSDIYLIGRVTLKQNANVTLLLEDTSYITQYIEVPPGAVLTIDSLNGSDAADRLIMPTEATNANTHARIGGSAGSAAGTININGGGIDIISHSSGACIGGGGGQSGYAGNGGAITINGGNLSVTQYGSSAGGSGAGIGGGGMGSGGGGGHGGQITINGGKVTVRQHTVAAGIGAGTFGAPGTIVINGGAVDSDATGSGQGAAIGGSGSTGVSGVGYISIHGGTVRAVAEYTGIGIVNSGNACHIQITGGTVTAKGMQGPGIGFYITYAGDDIEITGGTVFAESRDSAAIGGRISTTLEPPLKLGAGVNVRAYSGGAVPAINAQSNTGDGYFVNAGLNTAISPSAGTALHVVAGTQGGMSLKVLTLPANYRNFAYSSDLAESRTDNVHVYNGAAITGTIARVSDSNPEIYSIKTRTGYNAHNNSANNALLPAKLTGASAGYYVVYRANNDTNEPDLIQATGVSGGDATIEAAALPERFAPPDGLPAFLGWNTQPDGNGAKVTPGGPWTISGNTTLYAIWGLEIQAALTVTKTVLGAYGDRTKAFSFTAAFTGADGAPLPEGTPFTYEILTAGGTLVPESALYLADGGTATFSLKHGQHIIIGGVPGLGKVQIVENDYTSSYETSFVDMAEPNVSVPNTDEKILEMGGADKTVHFTNTRLDVPLTGTETGDNGALILPVTALLSVVVWLIVRAAFRRITGVFVK